MNSALSNVGAYDKVRDPIEFMRIVGDDIAKCGMFGCSTIEQGRILALTCLKKGIDPLSIAERYHIIKGDLSMRSDAMLAGIGQFGGKYRVVRRTADAAEIEITREDDKQRFALTWEEAKAEPFTKAKDGSIKENYATPRTRMQMLWARVVSDGVRTMWPEVVTGYYTPEEIADTNGEAIDASFTVARQAEAEIDAAPVVDPAQGQSMEIDGPCTADQVATIKTIATEIEQLQPGITAKVRVKILEAGLQKLADLSCREADMLIQTLRLKNLEAFFTAKIEGFRPRDILPSDEQKKTNS